MIEIYDTRDVLRHERRAVDGECGESTGKAGEGKGIGGYEREVQRGSGQGPGRARMMRAGAGAGEGRGEMGEGAGWHMPEGRKRAIKGNRRGGKVKVKVGGAG